MRSLDRVQLGIGQHEPLGAGVLELSTDGTTFEKLADFENGRAEAAVQGKIVKAVRIRCTKAQPQGLIIREVTLE